MVQALTDRLVEAFAERLHADMRKDVWGYAADEKVSAACCTFYCPSSVRLKTHRTRGPIPVPAA